GGGVPRTAYGWSGAGGVQRTAYSTSEQDRFRCIWAQHLDATKHAVGQPLGIFHAHEARRSLFEVGGEFSLSVVRDKILFNMGERTGNVWLKPLVLSDQ